MKMIGFSRISDSEIKINEKIYRENVFKGVLQSWAEKQFGFNS